MLIDQSLPIIFSEKSNGRIIIENEGIKDSLSSQLDVALAWRCNMKLTWKLLIIAQNHANCQLDRRIATDMFKARGRAVTRGTTGYQAIRTTAFVMSF
jgi:hypothetical protein